MLASSRGGLAEDRLVSGAPQSRGAAAAASHGVWGGPALRTGWHLQETLDASWGSSSEVSYGDRRGGTSGRCRQLSPECLPRPA